MATLEEAKDAADILFHSFRGKEPDPDLWLAKVERILIRFPIRVVQELSEGDEGLVYTMDFRPTPHQVKAACEAANAPYERIAVREKAYAEALTPPPEPKLSDEERGAVARKAWDEGARKDLAARKAPVALDLDALKEKLGKEPLTVSPALAKRLKSQPEPELDPDDEWYSGA